MTRFQHRISTSVKPPGSSQKSSRPTVKWEVIGKPAIAFQVFKLAVYTKCVKKHDPVGTSQGENRENQKTNKKENNFTINTIYIIKLDTPLVCHVSHFRVVVAFAFSCFRGFPGLAVLPGFHNFPSLRDVFFFNNFR